MPVELDCMENYTSDELAQAAYVSDDFEPGAWDLLDEDCAAIEDWVDEDTGNAESKVNPAGQFEFDSNISAADNRHAVRNRDIGSYPNTFTVEIRLHHDAIGTLADEDGFIIECYQADENVRIYFNSDGLFIYDTGSGYTEVGTNLVKCNGSAEWQVWRFLITFTGVTGEGTCDVYLYDSTHDWEEVGTAIPCSREEVSTDGQTKLIQYGHATDDRITHMDYIKIFDGLQPPSLQCFSEDTIKEEGTYSLKGVAQATDSLNDTLTRTVDPTIDIKDRDRIKFDIRASRTGSNIKIAIRDSGTTVTEYTPNIAQANTWQEVKWYIGNPKVTNANKDAIDRIIITIINADSDNTFYIDNMQAYGLAKAVMI